MTKTERSATKQYAVRALSHGICNNCGKDKDTIFKGYCEVCRKQYGRDESKIRNQGVHRAIEDARYEAEHLRQSIESKSITSKERDYELEAHKLKVALTNLIHVLNEYGFDDEALKVHKHIFGNYREPFKTFVEVKRLLGE